MEHLRWFNSTQPQTLQLAQILLYLNAVFAAFGALLSGGFVPSGRVSGLILGLTLLSIVVIVGQAGAALGIANSRKLGYRVGVTCAFLPVVLQLFYLIRYRVVATNLFNLLFEVALIAALLHHQSREYQRIWFE
jgi:hypothetical protein